MGLLTILKKIKQSESEVRLLILYAVFQCAATLLAPFNLLRYFYKLQWP